MHVNQKLKLLRLIGHQILLGKFVPLWIRSILNRRFIKKFVRKYLNWKLKLQQSALGYKRQTLMKSRSLSYFPFAHSGRTFFTLNHDDYKTFLSLFFLYRKVQTSRCAGECGCEQKYKWHRLLAYDPDNDCKGIFMDWFLFPSCCVCRCNPLWFSRSSMFPFNPSHPHAEDECNPRTLKLFYANWETTSTRHQSTQDSRKLNKKTTMNFCVS